MVQKVSRISSHMKMFVSFAFFGLVAAGIDFSIFAILIWTGINPIIGNFLSSSAGILINYFLVSNFTFGVDFRSLKNSMLFFVVAVTILMFSSILLGFLINQLGLNSLLAKFLTFPLSAILKYAINKRYNFKSV